MIRVFLVDDEIATREGIRSSFPWDEEYSLVGEAPDGEIALSMIMDEKPDVVITDIRMPFMDGLELCRNLRTSMPWVRVIILSGYSDFDYAKQAITLGVVDYLVKPVSVVDLKAALDRIRARIDEERQKRVNARNLQRRLASESRFVQDKLLGSLLLEPIDSENAGKMRAQMLHLGLNIDSPYYTVLDVTFRFAENGRDQGIALLLPIADSSGNKVLLCTATSGARALVMGDSREDTEERAWTVGSSFVYTLEHGGAADVLVTVGEICEHLTGLYHSMKSARHVRHVMEKRQSASRLHIAGVQEAEDYPADLRTFEIMPLYEQLQYITEEELPNVFRAYIASLQELGIRTEMSEDYLKMEGLMTALRIVREAGGVPEQVLDRGDYETALSRETDENAMMAVESLLSEAVAYRQSTSPMKGNHAVILAIQYLSQHFTNPNLMLKDVAQAACMSNSRFSTVFSQETGMTFTNYLTGLRIGKAKELLQATELRSSQICFAVGYNDRHYFSYLFKKVTGMTPSDYRTYCRKSMQEKN